MSVKRVVLASSSPRRRELIRLAGVTDPVIIPSDADESMDHPVPPDELVLILSERKSRAVKDKVDFSDVVIGSDTVVSYHGEILGKPSSPADAKRMLLMLSGNVHTVYTGLCVLYEDQKFAVLGSADVSFRDLTESEIDTYIASGDPLDKAGAYGMQSGAAPFVKEIHGDYYSIVGLPVCQLSVILRQINSSCEEMDIGIS